MTHTITEPRTRTYVVTYRNAEGDTWERFYTDRTLAVCFANAMRRCGFADVRVDGREVR